ncbi:hypothetical protein AB0M46_07590 [Dactylosporangium sp. NPDC051485]|uniref:hypothetical protein n=1 Tax=Dactylosporangium sp. NPDC051485 TaxID=3154846 RepID=UPI003422EA1A
MRTLLVLCCGALALNAAAAVAAYFLPEASLLIAVGILFMVAVLLGGCALVAVFLSHRLGDTVLDRFRATWRATPTTAAVWCLLLTMANGAYHFTMRYAYASHGNWRTVPATGALSAALGAVLLWGVLRARSGRAGGTGRTSTTALRGAEG